MRESVAIPAVRQKRSKLAPTSCHASFTSAVVSGPGAVIILFMALPFFVESAPRAYRLKGATPTLLFQHRTGHPPPHLLSIVGVNYVGGKYSWPSARRVSKYEHEAQAQSLNR